MDIKLTSAGSLKVGNYIIMNGAPCIVKSIQTSRPGKHGHAKCRIEAVGMIDGSKRIEIFPGHDKVQVPIIEKKNAQVLSITESTANVMDMETYETFDLKIPEDLKAGLSEGAQVIYWKVMNEKIMKQVK
ncbi:translation initiation factor IF-5A [archaeon]|nr:translation initiation factor IF-5A [archaeon]